MNIDVNKFENRCYKKKYKKEKKKRKEKESKEKADFTNLLSFVHDSR